MDQERRFPDTISDLWLRARYLRYRSAHAFIVFRSFVIPSNKKCIVRTLNINQSNMLSIYNPCTYLNTTIMAGIVSLKEFNRPGHMVLYSSIVFTQSHSPFRFSFHKVTLLSPPETANTFPLRLQLTRHITASKLSVILFQSLGREGSVVHIRTVLSCEAEAI